jgi:sugar phosphate isomerase/epimerase
MSSLTLTRAEAVAVALASFDATEGGLDTFPFDIGDPKACRQFSHQLNLEIAIRDGGDWWGDTDPANLESDARLGGTCPETFEMSSAGMRAIAELLPWTYAYTRELLAAELGGEGAHPEDIALAQGRVSALEGLAQRLGVELEPLESEQPS